MAHGDVQVSPWIWSAADYQGNSITITIPFNNATKAIQNGSSIVRDPGCVYAHMYIGLGADGTPDTTVRAFAVSVGTRTVTANQMGAVGLHTIDDVLNLQITAGP
jgi:hypothetical protein